MSNDDCKKSYNTVNPLLEPTTAACWNKEPSILFTFSISGAFWGHVGVENVKSLGFPSSDPFLSQKLVKFEIFRAKFASDGFCNIFTAKLKISSYFQVGATVEPQKSKVSHQVSHQGLKFRTKA